MRVNFSRYKLAAGRKSNRSLTIAMPTVKEPPNEDISPTTYGDVAEVTSTLEKAAPSTDGGGSVDQYSTADSQGALTVSLIFHL